MSVFAYKGYNLPVDLVEMTGGGTDTFDDISKHHISVLREEIGIEPNHTFLEIGCGIGRDAIPLADILTDGSYVGVDIIAKSIDWCSNNITPRHPSFTFHHLDIEDPFNNPYGKTHARACRFPVEDGSVDRIILWSVFTHMLRFDIVHYLDEFKRVLKPDGKVLMTCFIGDPASLEATRRSNNTVHNLRFEHEWGPGCYVNDISLPGLAVAYTEPAVREMVQAAGLTFAGPIMRGNWSGLVETDRGQDIIVLTR